MPQLSPPFGTHDPFQKRAEWLHKTARKEKILRGGSGLLLQLGEAFLVGLLPWLDQKEEARSVIIDANQSLMVSGQSAGPAGATFLLLEIDTGKAYK